MKRLAFLALAALTALAPTAVAQAEMPEVAEPDFEGDPLAGIEAPEFASEEESAAEEESVQPSDGAYARSPAPPASHKADTPGPTAALALGVLGLAAVALARRPRA